MDLEKGQRREGGAAGTRCHEEREADHDCDLDDDAHTHQGHVNSERAPPRAGCGEHHERRPDHGPDQGRDRRRRGPPPPPPTPPRSTPPPPPPPPAGTPHPRTP